MTKHLRALLPAVVLGILVLAAACSGGSDNDGSSDVTGTGAGPLGLGVTVASNRVAAGDAIPLTVTLRNESGGALTVARPAIVPLLVYLEVKRAGGDEVPFDGPWLRPRPLGRDDFVELAAGESVAHDFDLAAFYTLEAGSYSVVARYANPQDGAALGLHALVIDDADAVVSDAVPFEVQ